MLTYRIDEMTCGHCASTITRALNGLDPNARVSIDLSRHRVTVEASDATAAELQQAIAEATLDWLGMPGIVYDPADVHRALPASPVGPPETAGAVREYLHGRAATIYGGSNEIQRNIIAKAELAL